MSTELRECVNVVTSGFEHVNKHEMASHAQWALSIIYQHECKALIMCMGQRTAVISPPVVNGARGMSDGLCFVAV